MIISFNWTTEALLSGKKTMTRRCWKDTHAKRFKVGDFVKAYDKLPYHKGKQIATIQIIKNPYKQPLTEITMNDIKKEGGLWKSVEEFKKLFKNRCQDPWVIEFKLVAH